jgi:Bacterial SH3 domain
MRFCSKPLGAALGIAAVAAVIMATPGRAQQSPGAGQPPARHFGYRTGSSAIVLAKVNLRSGPGTESEILASIPTGSTIDVGQCEGEWCAVTWNGRSGYAIARNLDLGGSHQASSYPPPAQPGGYPEGHDYPPGAYSPPAQSGGYAEGYDHPSGAYSPPAQPGGYPEGHDYPPNAYSPPAQPGGYPEGHDYPPRAYAPPAQPGGYPEGHDYRRRAGNRDPRRIRPVESRRPPSPQEGRIPASR